MSSIFADIYYKILFKRYLFQKYDIEHFTSTKKFYISVLFLSEIQYKSLLIRYFFETYSMTCNTSIQISNFTFLSLFSADIKHKTTCKKYLLDKYDN